MFIQANGAAQSGQVTSRPDDPALRQIQHDVRQMPFGLPELTTATFPSHMQPFEAVEHLLKESRSPSERLFMMHSGEGAKEAIFQIANQVFQRPQWGSVTQVQVMKQDSPGAGVIRDLYAALQRGPVTIGSGRQTLVPLLGPMLQQRAYAENAFKSGKLLDAGMLMVVPAGMEKLSNAQRRLLNEHADTLAAEIASRKQETNAASSPRASREDLRAREEEGVYVNFPLRDVSPQGPRRPAPIAPASRPTAGQGQLQDSARASAGSRPGSPSLPEQRRPSAGLGDAVSRSVEDLSSPRSPGSPIISRTPRNFRPTTEPVAHAVDQRPGIQLGRELGAFGKSLVDDYAESSKSGVFNRKPKGSTGAAGATSNLVNELNTHKEKLKTWILELRERVSDMTGADFNDALIKSLHDTVAFTARQVKDRGPLTRHVKSDAFQKAFEDATAIHLATANAMKNARPDQRQEAWAEAIAARATLAVFQGLSAGGTK